MPHRQRRIRRAPGVAAVLLATLVFAGCTSDDEPTVAPDPSPSSASSGEPSAGPTEQPSQEPSEQPSEQPTELGGPTLVLQGVRVPLPEGFDEEVEAGQIQQSTVNEEDQFASLSVLGAVGQPTREERLDFLLGSSLIEGRTTVEEDQEIAGEPFLRVSGRYDVVEGFRIDIFQAVTDDLDITLRFTSPGGWSQERVDAYLEPILASVVLP